MDIKEENRYRNAKVCDIIGRTGMFVLRNQPDPVYVYKDEHGTIVDSLDRELPWEDRPKMYQCIQYIGEFGHKPEFCLINMPYKEKKVWFPNLTDERAEESRQIIKKLEQKKEEFQLDDDEKIKQIMDDRDKKQMWGVERYQSLVDFLNSEEKVNFRNRNRAWWKEQTTHIFSRPELVQEGGDEEGPSTNFLLDYVVIPKKLYVADMETYHCREFDFTSPTKKRVAFHLTQCVPAFQFSSKFKGVAQTVQRVLCLWCQDISPIHAWQKQRTPCCNRPVPTFAHWKRGYKINRGKTKGEEVRLNRGQNNFGRVYKNPKDLYAENETKLAIRNGDNWIVPLDRFTLPFPWRIQTIGNDYFSTAFRLGFQAIYNKKKKRKKKKVKADFREIMNTIEFMTYQRPLFERLFDRDYRKDSFVPFATFGKNYIPLWITTRNGDRKRVYIGFYDPATESLDSTFGATMTLKHRGSSFEDVKEKSPLSVVEIENKFECEKGVFPYSNFDDWLDSIRTNLGLKMRIKEHEVSQSLIKLHSDETPPERAPYKIFRDLLIPNVRVLIKEPNERNKLGSVVVRTTRDVRKGNILTRSGWEQATEFSPPWRRREKEDDDITGLVNSLLLEKESVTHFV